MLFPEVIEYLKLKELPRNERNEKLEILNELYPNLSIYLAKKDALERLESIEKLLKEAQK